jgi:membrane protease YdiL (CAAX protease family)
MLVMVYYGLHVGVFPHLEYLLDPLNDLMYSRLSFNAGFCLDDIMGVFVLFNTWLYHRVNGLSLPRLLNLSEKRAPWSELTLKPMHAFFLVLSIFFLYYWTSGLYPICWQISTFLTSKVMGMGGAHAAVEAMQSNLVVLLMHTAWVIPSVALLRKVPAFLPSPSPSPAPSAAAAAAPSSSPSSSRWWAGTPRANWAWWVVGGYAVSILLFRLADAANAAALLSLPFLGSGGSGDDVVANMVAQALEPGSYSSSSGSGSGSGLVADVAALAVGSVAPCLTAPVWEEFFYRGFIYPWLSSFLPMLLATPVSALVFAAHHAQADAFFPLAVLGLVWALLYLLSGNLLVVVLVHAMWNSRIFLTGLLALLASSP